MILVFPTQNKISKHLRTLRNKNVTTRCAVEVEALYLVVVKENSTGIHEMNWALFKKFCVEPRVQEGNCILDPDSVC